MLIPAELIRKKRDGGALTQSEIEFFIAGYTKSEIPDYQMAALLMAIVLKGMSSEEIHFLTQSMLHSGVVMDFPATPAFKVDKHSTGGIGDKTSLLLAPIVASLGVPVPMISGRGLGFTGGTLDKLESIPGFNTQQDLGRFRSLVEKHGLALIGQTKEICPADKKIYALRDVTGTVESLALISASIMSKKLAEGIDGLVLDVKFGSGAFMKQFEQAEALARSLMQIAVRGGKRVTAFLTDMNQPLGRMIGNSLEIEECLKILRGEDEGLRFEDTKSLSLDLSAAMISMATPNTSMEQARGLAEAALRDGRALKKFEEICVAQGGRLEQLPKAPQTREVIATSDGYITGFHNEGLGYAAIALRAGRLKSDDVLDPAAGIEILKKIGDRVQKGEPIAKLYASDARLFAAAEERVLSSVQAGPSTAQPGPLIRKILKESDL